jgi:hypothetical protein
MSLVLAVLAVFVARVRSGQVQDRDGHVDEDKKERTVGKTRVKRDFGLTAILTLVNGAIAGAFAGVGAKEITRFKQDISSNECGAFFEHANPDNDPPGVVDVNFKTRYDDNWSKEILGPDFNVWSFDRTRERVDGGKYEIYVRYYDVHQNLS